MVVQIAEAYAQVMVHRVRHADGEAEAKQALSEAEDVEIVVAAEQPAGDRSPQKRCGSEGEIGKVSGCEQKRRYDDSGVTGHNAGEPRHEVVLQEELLVERPQNISANMSQVGVV